MQKQFQRRKTIADLLDFCSMFFTDSHHVTPMGLCSFHVLSFQLYSLHLYTFDPLTFLGSSTGRRIIHRFRVALQPRRDQKLLEQTTFFYNFYMISYYSLHILRISRWDSSQILYTFSKSIYLISLFVRLQVVSTLSKHSNYSEALFLHIAMLWSSQAMSGHTSLEAFQHAGRILGCGWSDGLSTR